MSKNDRLEREARQLCRHTICFTDIESAMVAVRAMQGRTTRSIAEEFGLTMSKAQYRVLKAQRALDKPGSKERTSFRSDFRNGRGPLAEMVASLTTTEGMRFVERKVASKYIKYARPGVPRIALAA